jgi:hypothetical protein
MDKTMENQRKIFDFIKEDEAEFINDILDKIRDSQFAPSEIMVENSEGN